MIRKISTFIISGLILTGCASQTGWSPTIDPYNDPDPGRISADKAECKDLALQASGGTTTEVAKGAAGGAAIGAAGGALLGALSGGTTVAQGALAGAAIGGMGGGVSQGMSAEEAYKRAFTNCLRNRGHNVIN